MAILIGCSGWSYDDWVERFYPANIGSKKSEWLGYYGKFFPTVEINSTFYRVPTDDVVKAWVEKGSKMGKFEFSVKMPDAVSHDSIVSGSAEKAAAQAESFEAICVEPLFNAGLLGSVLLQLSPEFTFDSRGSLAKLRAVFAQFPRRCFVGHTHRPCVITDQLKLTFDKDCGYEYVFPPGEKAVVNVSSVGQPRDRDPRACYALLDEERVRWRRVAYDIEATVRKVRECPCLDPICGERLRLGK